MKLLIVDDDKAIRELLAGLALREGHEVWEASTGREAKALLEDKGGVDLILLDFLLPDMSGFAFLRWVKLLPGYGSIPVVLMSVLDQSKYLQEATRLGAEFWISKTQLVRVQSFLLFLESMEGALKVQEKEGREAQLERVRLRSSADYRQAQECLRWLQTHKGAVL
ncbi:MAG: response regulator [Elusimicrobia bacterium]|nr:response regulator [Elusimicrobiota bacterium]